MSGTGNPLLDMTPLPGFDSNGQPLGGGTNPSGAGNPLLGSFPGGVTGGGGTNIPGTGGGVTVPGTNTGGNLSSGPGGFDANGNPQQGGGFDANGNPASSAFGPSDTQSAPFGGNSPLSISPGRGTSGNLIGGGTGLTWLEELAVRIMLTIVGLVLIAGGFHIAAARGVFASTTPAQLATRAGVPLPATRRALR